MIEHLEVGSSAHFYLLKRRMPAAAINQMFNGLRARSRRPSPNLFRVVRETAPLGTLSAICFSHERQPGFLNAAAGVYDRVHGFVALIERAGFVAVIKVGLELPAGFKTRYLGKVNRDWVEGAIATAEAIFERVRVQSTSPSAQIVRSKTFEAANLAESMPLASAGRYFTQGYSVARDDGHFSTTPSTGRISQRGDKESYEGAIVWAATVIDQLGANNDQVSQFVRNFARRLDLESLPDGTAPILFAVNVPKLTELLLSERPEMRLFRLDPATGQPQQLTAVQIKTILQGIDSGFEVRPGRPDYRIKRGARTLGTLKMNKSRIGAKPLDFPRLQGIFIERVAEPLGHDPDRTTLKRYIDRQNLFTVLFNDPALTYVEGELFRDQAMLDGGATFLSHLRPFVSLQAATSEKGDFQAGQAQFSANSVFRLIIDDIAHSDDVLVCDDLGDEWADFVGLNTQTRPPSISFYHGKHGGLTLGASDFHIGVSQAEKNLGRMNLPPDAMPAKFVSWAPAYISGNGVQTAIARAVRGGTLAEIEQSISDVRGAPDTVKHVHIVTSSLSKAQVEAAFAHLVAGGRPSAHFVQLYWLLSAYFSACADMGAVGFVVCQP